MIDLILNADLKLLHLINFDWTSPFLDWFMATITDYGVWKWPVCVVAAGLLIWGGYRERVFVLMTIVVVLIGGEITGALKRLTNRPRPFQHVENVRHLDLGGVRISTPGPVEKGRSMPSGHMANNVVFAYLASAIYGRRGRLAWLLALLIGYSRIYTGNHYPSDVVAGFFVALGYTYAAIWAAGKLWQVIGPRWLPKVYQQHPDLISESKQKPPMPCDQAQH